MATGLISNKKVAWMRVIEIRLYSRLTPNKIIYGNYTNDNVEQLNINISGVKKIATNQDTCTVKITNLSYEDILKLTIGEYYGVEIWAGYKSGDIFKWFDGEVAYISPKLINRRDYETTILCASRLVASFTQNRMKLALNSGINIYTAYKYIANKANISSSHLNPNLKNQFLNQATSILDTPKNLLSLINSQQNEFLSADTNDGVVFDITNISESRQILIDRDTISFVNGNPTVSSTGLDLYLLPTFDFRVGDIIIIDNALININSENLKDAQTAFKANYLDTTLIGKDKENKGLGMYLIKELDFNFQNRGSTFNIHINGRAISLLRGDLINE